MTDGKVSTEGSGNMKTKKTLGILAMALTALACALPRTAKAAGDIRSIEVY